MAFVRIASTESLHAIGAFIGSFARVPSTMFLVMRWVTELTMTIWASESRQVGVDQHMVIETMLASEDGSTSSAFVWLDA